VPLFFLSHTFWTAHRDLLCGPNVTPHPLTTNTTVLSYPCYPSYFYSLHSPNILSMFFLLMAHFAPLTRPALSMSCLDRAPIIRYFQVLIPVFRSGLSSSPRENYHAFCDVRGPHLANRYLHSKAHNGQPSPTASTTSFHQRCFPPFAAQTVPSQFRRATSPLYHNTSRDGSPEPP
jgi:hypothetical protein